MLEYITIIHKLNNKKRVLKNSKKIKARRRRVKLPIQLNFTLVEFMH